MNGRMLVLCTVLALALATPSRLARAAAPLRCFAADTSTATHELGAPIADTIGTTDGTQTGRLQTGAPAAPSVCGVVKAPPAAVDATTEYPYRAYTFVNRSRSAACIEVLANVTAGPPEVAPLGAGFRQSAAYLGAFDAGAIRASYLGDNGTHESGPGAMHYGFDVPALATFVVVISWTGLVEAGYEPSYELFVGGCGQLVATGISPESGPVGGDTLVTIKGSGFEGAAPLTVDIGGAPATQVLAVDDTTLLAVTAAAAAGTYDVVVKSTVVTDGTGRGASSTLPAAYRYVADAASGADAGTDGGNEGLVGDAGAGGEVAEAGEADAGPGGAGGEDGGGGVGADADVDAGSADASAPRPRPGGSGSGSGVPARDDSGGGCSASGAGDVAGAAWLLIVGGAILIMRRRHAGRVG